MDTQFKKVLSFYEILKCMIGKTVYVLCDNSQNVYKGVISKLDYTKLVLLTDESYLTIYPRDIAGINIINATDEINTIENNMISDTNNPFNRFLNMHVYCLPRKTPGGHSGILTYVGSNYVTIFNKEDNEFSRIPIAEIRDMATNLAELKV